MLCSFKGSLGWLQNILLFLHPHFCSLFGTAIWVDKRRWYFFTLAVNYTICWWWFQWCCYCRRALWGSNGVDSWSSTFICLIVFCLLILVYRFRYILFLFKSYLSFFGFSDNCYIVFISSPFLQIKASNQFNDNSLNIEFERNIVVIVTFVIIFLFLLFCSLISLNFLWDYSDSLHQSLVSSFNEASLGFKVFLICWRILIFNLKKVCSFWWFNKYIT